METQEITLILNKDIKNSKTSDLIKILDLIHDMGYTITSMDSNGINAQRNNIPTKIKIAEWDTYYFR